MALNYGSDRVIVAPTSGFPCLVLVDPFVYFVYRSSALCTVLLRCIFLLLVCLACPTFGVNVATWQRKQGPLFGGWGGRRTGCFRCFRRTIVFLRTFFFLQRSVDDGCLCVWQQQHPSLIWHLRSVQGVQEEKAASKVALQKKVAWTWKFEACLVIFLVSTLFWPGKENNACGEKISSPPPHHHHHHHSSSFLVFHTARAPIHPSIQP